MFNVYNFGLTSVRLITLNTFVADNTIATGFLWVIVHVFEVTLFFSAEASKNDSV